jgi:ABC-2 type transport system ATP-binding protein
MHTLAVEDLTKRYKQGPVVQNLSFQVFPGRVTGFLGPNGSGKSTTMKVLLGLARADGGRATIGGRLYRDLPDPARTVGAVLESNAFHPARSARNHLLVLADALGVPANRVDELLELVDLTPAADRRVGAYSLGMRQRLGLAGALLADPPVLVLDEPGNGLDPQGIRWLRDLLREQAKGGRTVFVSSHLLAEVEHLADEIVVIDRGRLVTAGAIGDLEQSEILVRTPTPLVVKAVIEEAGGRVKLHDDGSLLVAGLSIEEIGERAHSADVVLHELSFQSGSLEELFLSWTGSRETVETAPELEEVLA